jgi:hypothetical protein
MLGLVTGEMGRLDGRMLGLFTGEMGIVGWEMLGLLVGEWLTVTEGVIRSNGNIVKRVVISGVEINIEVFGAVQHGSIGIHCNSRDIGVIEPITLLKCKRKDLCACTIKKAD